MVEENGYVKIVKLLGQKAKEKMKDTKSSGSLLYASRCYNGGNKHNFKPRYSEKPNSKNLRIRNSLNPRAMMYYDVYEYDVCEWCGKIAK